MFQEQGMAPEAKGLQGLRNPAGVEVDFLRFGGAGGQGPRIFGDFGVVTERRWPQQISSCGGWELAPSEMGLFMTNDGCRVPTLVQ